MNTFVTPADPQWVVKALCALAQINRLNVFRLLVVAGQDGMYPSKEYLATLNPKFENLLNEKRKINSSITVNDRYKIQIFYGTNDEAKKTLVNFRKEFRNMDGTIVYNNPSYKVWIGSFKTRIEAEKNLLDIKKKYPNALLIKPNKQ